MKLKQGTDVQYQDYKAKNNADPYSAAVVSYAERWAELMEAALDSGTPLSECAKRLSHDADHEGITGFMYGCAVSALNHFWVHGEALRKWHNLDTQVGTEGEKANTEGGVLNPAIMVVGDGDG